ncbi:MAG: nucleotidyl transferase AbiEii/AbiGii toxin family protein [bacterium]|nr:nucleotidyl transferase AbiEii/AbiGii toxin family protein [bacterium]MBU1916876.1 nucleotidyl transferase AbiEii/AbiGii toxin family protein [bacterium]
MIENKTHTKEWLDSLLKNYPHNDPILLEKCCKALTLLEQIKLAKLDFIFRGGTSLLLLFDSPRRLSIDIDVIVPGKPDDFEEMLSQLTQHGVFTRVEQNIRKQKESVPKAHYKFYFDSLATQGESYVLLDVLFDKNPYPNVIQKPILNKLISTIEPITKVAVPDIDSILGDKFTTIAPNTIGIPFDQNKVLEIGKQIYDIDFLFDHITDISTVRASFESIAAQEISYRNNDLSIEDVLKDSFEICLATAFQGTKDKKMFSVITEAMKRVRNFSIENKGYTLDDALRVSGKLAYLIQLFKTKAEFEKYSDPSPAIDWVIENPEYNRINKIKKRSIESFYYWFKALQLMG